MYENAKYVKNSMSNNDLNSYITVDINDITSFVPLDPANIDYQNIMQLVEEGKLTIQPADNINNQNS